MWLLILEAVAALALLLFAVWWTMFSGRADSEAKHLAAHEETKEEK